MSVVIVLRRYILRRKLLHKMKEVCGAISHKMDKLIHSQVDGTQLLIYFTYMYIFFHTFVQVR